MRKLATIQKILAIDPIEGADAIEVATVNGWKVVVKKGEFVVGEEIVYFEIDSWIPHNLAPFLSKGNEPREYEGIKGERLRTVRLRGQISQGLILPLNILPHSCVFSAFVGDDVSDVLGVVKWEAPIPAQLAGVTRGNFPSFLQKTDEERIQNLVGLLPEFVGITFGLHEKLDGSSMTVYHNNGDFGVCSRNLDLKDSEGNSFWQMAKSLNLPEKMPAHGNICIQGELIGSGIQKNPYGLNNHDFYVFNVFDIDSGKYLNYGDARWIVEQMGLKWVPFVQDYTITESDTVGTLLALAEGKSVLNPKAEREGLVWRPYEEQEVRGLGRLSFKTISNKFLLKGGD